MKVDKFILKNGLKILQINNPSANTVAVGIFVGVGSRHESNKLNGISHFLEHLMFKSNDKYTTAEIAEKLDSLGAKYNAETSYESTHYYIYGDSKNYLDFIDIICNIYLSPKLDKQDIELERGVVIEELNSFIDDQNEIINDRMNETLFNNSQLKNPIIGTEKNIKSFTRNDLVNYRKKYYVPENTVFVISGNFNKDKSFNLIKKLLEPLKKSNNDLSYELNQLKPQTKPRLILDYDENIAQTDIMITFRSESMYSENNFKYDIISDILASGISSRLFKLLRNKMAITYSIYSYNIAYKSEGVFVINIGVNNGRVDEAIRKILNEIRFLRENGISEEELEKCKKIRETALKLSFQTPQDLLQYAGLEELFYKKVITLEKRIEFYNKINLKDINNLMEILFKSENLNIIIYGAFIKDKEIF